MFTMCILCDAEKESFSYALVDHAYSKTYIKMICTILAEIKISYLLIKCSQCNILDGLTSVYYSYVSIIQVIIDLVWFTLFYLLYIKTKTLKCITT
jgi:hypothetical protein